MRYYLILLAVAVGVYALPHLYLLRKVLRTFRVSLAASLSLVALFSVMTIAPMIARALATNGHPAAPAVNLVVFTWMAGIFWMVAFGALIDAWNLAGGWILRRRPLARICRIVPRRQFWIMAGLTLAAATWASIEARCLQVRRFTIECPGLPPGSKPVRVVFFSDLHLSAASSHGLLDRVVREVQALQPDLIISGGDLIDSPAATLSDEAAQLRTLHAPLGVYGVLGNHEWYIGLREALAFHQNANIQLMRASWIRPVPGLTVAGVDDPSGAHFGASDFSDEKKLFARAAPGSFHLLIKHQPRISGPARSEVDLQLSGHTHGGQIFPFHLAAALMNTQLSGWKTYGSRTHVYVTRGAGVWGPPFRFLAPPEVVLLTLTPPRP